MQLNPKVKTALKVGAVLMVVAGGASAQADVSGASAAFTGVETAVDTIGPLMLGAAAAGIIYKWVTAFLL